MPAGYGGPARKHPAGLIGKLMKLTELLSPERVLPNIAAETPWQAMEELIQRRIHLLLYHEETLARLPHFDRLRVTKLVTEPYFTICRPGHKVLQSDRTLEDIVRYDWAIAGFDSHFEASLSIEVQAMLRRHDFPKYRLLSQAACIDLIKDSDIITAVPKSSGIRWMRR